MYGLSLEALTLQNQVRVLATPSLLGAKVARLAVHEEASDRYRQQGLVPFISSSLRGRAQRHGHTSSFILSLLPWTAMV